MIDIVIKNRYLAFGLSVLSDIPLPELSSISEKKEKVDVIIKKEDLSLLWSQLSTHPYSVIVQDNFVMFQLPNVAIFLIKNGNEIIYTPLKEARQDHIRLYLLGSCMGALLMQRKVFPLHGSAIEIEGKAYAIVGESGAGKSTLASTFLKKGYKLLSDDVVAVTIADNNIPYVTSSYPQQKLWQESLEQFGMGTEQFRPIYQRESKFAVPVASKFFLGALPLAGIFELVKGESEKIKLSKIQNLHRLNTILQHTYRNCFISGLGLAEWHFNTSVKMVNKLDIYQLSRPNSGFSVNELVSTVLNTLNKGD